MRFGAPQFLVLSLILPALTVAILAYGEARRRKLLERFAALPLLNVLTRSVSPAKRKRKATLLVLGVFFLGFSLSRPQWGYHWETVHRRGVDIVIALDTSKSMLATDVKPNRLEAAKREIKKLVHILQGDRIALVPFAGTAFVQCPLTLDYGAFQMFLDDVHIGTIPQGGTDIARAIRIAMRAFKTKLRKYKVLILITDGESHGQDPVAAAEDAAKEGIQIYTVGVGTPQGSLIWIEENGKRRILRDRNGNPVKSRLDETTLQKIALKTGGKYTNAFSQEWGLDRIYQKVIRQQEKRELASGRKKRYEERFQIPLAIGLLLLITESVLSNRRKQAERSSVESKEAA